MAEDLKHWQLKYESCIYSMKLLDKLAELNEQLSSTIDLTEIKKAIYWAKKYHHGQFRKSGEPYYSHPLEVAYMVAEYVMTTDVIVAAILHDIVEDTEVTLVMILDNFNERIMQLVQRLTTDNLKEVYNIFCEDKEAALIKLMDRRHNLMTINFMPKNKAIKKIQDSYDSRFLGMAAEISPDLEKEFNRLLGKKVINPNHFESSIFQLI